MPGPSDPEIVRKIRRFRAEILDRESKQMHEMAARWLETERALEDKIALVAREIAELEGPVPEWRIVQQERYRALLAQAQFETDKYIGYAEDLIKERELMYGRLGVDHALEALGELRANTSRVFGRFDRLPIDAIESMVGYAADGSPLRELLRPVYADAVQGLTQQLVNGIALGLNPREVAKMMTNGFGMGLNRSLLIARTEQLRAYRSANQLQFMRSRVIDRYRRLATHDSRVCLGCLFTEGETFARETDFEEHPQGRCTLVPELAGQPDTEFQTGKQWFETLPESDKLKMMGAQRYELYKDGLPLDAFVKHTTDPVWGGAFVPTPLRDIKAITGGGTTPIVASPFEEITGLKAGEASAISESTEEFLKRIASAERVPPPMKPLPKEFDDVMGAARAEGVDLENVYVYQTRGGETFGKTEVYFNHFEVYIAQSQVDLGARTISQQAETLAHELGHIAHMKRGIGTGDRTYRELEDLADELQRRIAARTGLFKPRK